MFSRGYENAKQQTNSYLGNSHPHSCSSCDSYYEMNEVEEAYNDCIQFEHLGG